MLENEEYLQRCLKETELLRKNAVDSATCEYFRVLGDSEYPDPVDIKAASHTVEDILGNIVVSSDWISAISNDTSEDEDKQAAIKISFYSVRPELKIPAPISFEDFSPVRLGIVALLGAILGMILLSPITRLLLGLKDVGIFVGAPVGAFLLFIAVWHSSKNKWLRRSLIVFFGVASIGEVWSLISKGGIFKPVWIRLGGHKSGLKRIILYIAVIFIILTTKPKTKYDKNEHDRIVRTVIDQWLTVATLTLAILLLSKSKERVSLKDTSYLIQQIMELRRIPSENLPVARDELIVNLKNMGYMIEDQQNKPFPWQEKFSEKYNIFGHVEPGDLVVIENEAIISNEGIVEKRGLIRRSK